MIFKIKHINLKNVQAVWQHYATFISYYQRWKLQVLHHVASKSMEKNRGHTNSFHVLSMLI